MIQAAKSQTSGKKKCALKNPDSITAAGKAQAYTHEKGSSQLIDADSPNVTSKTVLQNAAKTKC